MHAPARVVASGEVNAEVAAARLLAPEGRARDERGDGQEVARRWPEGRARYVLELGESALKRRARAEYADALPHQTPHALANGERRRARAPPLSARSRTRTLLFSHACLFKLVSERRGEHARVRQVL